jgi:hypothetical protein
MHPFRGIRACFLTSALAFVAMTAAEEAQSTKPTFRFDDGPIVTAELNDGTSIVRGPAIQGIVRTRLQCLDKSWPAKFVIRVEAKVLEGVQAKRRAKGEPVIRQKGKFFEVELPAEWLRDNPKHLDLIFIDQYR